MLKKEGSEATTTVSSIKEINELHSSPGKGLVSDHSSDSSHHQNDTHEVIKNEGEATLPSTLLTATVSEDVTISAFPSNNELYLRNSSSSPTSSCLENDDPSNTMDVVQMESALNESSHWTRGVENSSLMVKRVREEYEEGQSRGRTSKTPRRSRHHVLDLELGALSSAGVDISTVGKEKGRGSESGTRTVTGKRKSLLPKGNFVPDEVRE